ncbi:hypothetical protein [methanotrophic endosymbiont of Bathymodiolus puteoserpentis (Logatchev)]|jgi:hypothetical protein|uniref:hypothetical protein n=1 Tax=methanotrophic endosymbiont of Bathymodiolus puteoserpentis (Logatchev) TaxID=343235 RepID=UPI0013CC5461|nr:hypothetical protein [methanotrophic endosymbiont of Bathymodiolus puteoserpentis (Logatchev)]SHE20297.1 hypothetical protein BPUTEOMOX_2637 [methanotrophic endosymbiont of Bathymodiolus puteoserpentis (Logatchev)]
MTKGKKMQNTLNRWTKGKKMQNTLNRCMMTLYVLIIIKTSIKKKEKITLVL